MKISWRVGAVIVVLWTMMIVAPSCALASEPASSASPLSAEPVLGGSAELLAPGGAELAAEARRTSSEAVVGRQVSQSAYLGLSAEAAQKLAGEAFPGLVDRVAGGLSQLPEGDHVTAFVSPYVAQIESPKGQSTLVESLAPIAAQESSGRFAGLQLGLGEEHGAFAPQRAAVAGRVPKSLDEGVSLPALGVSLTPLVESVSTLASAAGGKLDGDAVFYGATSMGTNVDALARATSSGVELLAILRSPGQQVLRYRVGLPEGASLSQATVGGPVTVMDAGQPMAMIPAPNARDAEGTPVPVSMSVKEGDVLELTVADTPGSYRLPVAVDPEVNTLTEGFYLGNWHSAGAEGKGGPGYTYQTNQLEMVHSGSYGENDEGFYYMHTNGVSKIYEFSAELSTSGNVGSPPLESWVQISTANGKPEESSASWTNRVASVCAEAGCSTAAGAEGNSAEVVANTTASSQRPEEHYAPGFSLGASGETAYISQPKGTHSSTTYKTSEGEVDKTNNVLDAGQSWAKKWMGPEQGAFEFEAKDPGLGVAGTSLEVMGQEEEKWKGLGGQDFLLGGGCIGIQCSASQTEATTYDSHHGNWPEGEDRIRVGANDPMPGSSSLEYQSGEAVVMVDSYPPEGLAVSGLKNEGGGTFVLGETQAHLKAQATDSFGAVVTSGVKSFELYIDGKEVGKPNGSCEPGPCTASAEWTISGSEIGAGEHVLTVRVTDYAGNQASTNFKLEVDPVSPIALGPGSVNPESGDFALESSDVQMSGGMGDLEVTRHYDSLNPNEGTESPLGPQWTLSLGSLASLEVLPNGGVMISGPGGLVHFEKASNGAFKSPHGDSSLVLTQGSGEIEIEGKKYEWPGGSYVLENTTSGAVTRFTLPLGAKTWMPTVSQGKVATDTIADTYTTSDIGGKEVVEPLLEVAPHPAAKCEPPAHPNEPAKLERGCRALEFNYAKTTTATGEAPSEWGDYEGHLTRVYFTAWNPASKQMKTVTVAEYLYDSKGRLRAEWDPRIEPALRTTYGYDEEGHVTAMSSPGQEPWLIHYGTSEQDARAGRVLSVSRPKASVAIASTAAPVNTQAPKLSVEGAEEGQSVSVEDGIWSNSPLGYSYQWEDCSGACTPIAGATNPTYTVRPSDEGRELRVQVTATNAGGSTSASSPGGLKALLPVKVYTPTYSTSFGPGSACALSAPTYIAVVKKPHGEEVLDVSDTGANEIAEFSLSGECHGTFSSGGSEPTGIVSGENEVGCDLWVANSGSKALGCLIEDGKYYTSIASKGSGALAGIDDAQSGNTQEVNVADSGGTRIESFQEYVGTRSYLGEFGVKGKGEGQLEDPVDVLGAAAGTSYVLDKTNDRVEAFNKHEYTGELGGEGSGNGQLKQPQGMAEEGGIVWVSDTGNDRVQAFNAPGQPLGEMPPQLRPGAYRAQFGSKGSGEGQFEEPVGIALSAAGNIYVVDRKQDRVQEWLPGKGPAEPPLPPAEAASEPSNDTTTVEYYVPVSGEGAPQQMGTKEVEAWAQKDDPTYAMALLPPQKPQGWPAKSYEGASVYYLDARGRMVNVAGPSGGITSTEYNEEDEVTRALSADDRAKALGEGTKSAEVAKQLDTESTYEANGGPLLETKGPEHLVKLSSGEEKKARNKVRYFRNEGAPEGEEDGLITKTTDGAEVAGKEYDVRESSTSYSGQNDLGWSLGKPTSTTTDPKGLKLTNTTVYEPSTGNVIETRAPGAGAPSQESSTQLRSFGGLGPIADLFDSPTGIAVDSKGDVWVADTEVDRIDELSSTGSYITGFGSAGSGNGQLERPEGIAIDSKGDIWVADTGNNRLQEFSSTGKYMGQITEFGTVTAAWRSCMEYNTLAECAGAYSTRYESGTGKGAFKEPEDVSFDAKDNLYVTDTGNNRVQEAQVSGQYEVQFGTASGEGHLEAPTTAAVNSTGDVWVTAGGANMLVEFSPTGSYLTEDTSSNEIWPSTSGVTIDSEGNLWTTCDLKLLSSTICELSSKGVLENAYDAEGIGNGQFEDPVGIVAAGEDLWVADAGNSRVQEITKKGAYVTQYPSAPESMAFFKPSAAAVSSAHDIWVLDSGHDRIQETTAEGSFLHSAGSKGQGNGEFRNPQGITLDAAGHLWVADTGNDRIQELSSEGNYITKIGSKGTGHLQFEEPVGIVSHGEDLYVLDRSDDRVQEITTAGVFVTQFGSKGSGEGQFQAPTGIAIDKEGHIWVADSGNDRVQEFSSTGSFIRKFGSAGTGKGQFLDPTSVMPEENGDVWVADTANNRVQQLTSTGTYLQQLGNRSQFNEPTSIVTGPSTGQMVVLNRSTAEVAVWQPGNPNHEAAGAGGPHSSVTVYYSAQANSKYPLCGEHIEWVNLPCETLPGKQPETEGLPSLPTTRIEYNIYDQPEKTIEKFSATVERIRTTSYDEAGRPIAASVSAVGSKDTKVSPVSDTYSSETGALVEQSSEESNGKTQSIKSTYNKLGQLERYTDAQGNTTEYTYDGYGRLSKVLFDAGGLEPGPTGSYETYAYNETTGALTEVKDSAAKAFKATFDPEGNMTSETYPNGMTATYAYNSIGEAVSLSYEKTTECSQKCVWFSDSAVPSIHGEWLTQQSSLASYGYTYDAAGRLTEVKETPTGEGCAVRVYGYDAESDRTSLTTRPPGSEGKCATEGGETQAHSYDQADRLMDTGIAYEEMGNITKLPAADAGGSPIESTYYASGQLQHQKQGEQENEYLLDPESRTSATITGGVESKTTVEHYPGPGGSASWTLDRTTGGWSRQIMAFGALVAVQESGQEPNLQLTDLQGNIVATASLQETAQKLSTEERSTEFGVPINSKPKQQYTWLGAAGVSAETQNGTIVQDGSTYVPQIGRPLQTIHTTPPTPDNVTPFVSTTLSWVAASVTAAAAKETLLWQEEQRKIEEAKAAAEAAAEAEENMPQPTGEIVWPEAYYYMQAQILAEEEAEENIGATENATIASFKLRLNVGCIEAGFWTYCSGEYHYKWFSAKVAINPKSSGKSFSTGDRVTAGALGLGLVIKGGVTGIACSTAAAATPEDEGWPFLPLEIHCAAEAFSNVALGAAGVVASIFGKL